MGIANLHSEGLPRADMLRRHPDGFCCNEPSGPERENGELVVVWVAPGFDPVAIPGEAGDLQLQTELLAPEPMDRLVGLLIAEDRLCGGARLIGGILHRLDADRASRYRRKAGA